MAYETVKAEFLFSLATAPVPHHHKKMMQLFKPKTKESSLFLPSLSLFLTYITYQFLSAPLQSMSQVHPPLSTAIATPPSVSC